MDDPFPEPTETILMIESAWVLAAEKEILLESVRRTPTLNIASQIGPPIASIASARPSFPPTQYTNALVLRLTRMGF